MPMSLIRRFAVSQFFLLLLTAILGVAPLAAGEEKPPPPPLRLEPLQVVPSRPGPDTLCRLVVKVHNTGEQVASRLTFGIKINGEPVAGYPDLLVMLPVAPGTSAEVPLYNFWSTETLRPMPKDGKMTVEVELRKAEWMKIENSADGAEIWTPRGEVPGLPVSRTLVVPMEVRNAKR